MSLRWAKNIYTKVDGCDLYLADKPWENLILGDSHLVVVYLEILYKDF